MSEAKVVDLSFTKTRNKGRKPLNKLPFFDKSDEEMELRAKLKKFTKHNLIAFRLEPELYNALKAIAQRSHVSISVIVRNILRNSTLDAPNIRQGKK